MLAAVVLVLFLRRPERWQWELEADQLRHRPDISDTAAAPDWSALGAYQGTITEEDFRDQLTRVYSQGDAWVSEVKFGEGFAEIRTSGDGKFKLEFAPPDTSGAPPKPPRYWRAASELPPAGDLQARPLEGVRVAIDPGHIGGEWAKMEERWYRLEEGGTEVKEGELTLATAKLLEVRLEALGAEVTLVREEHEPVTALRPEDFMGLAEESLKAQAEEPSGRALEKEAESLFYRAHEIRQRARRINELIKPDIAVCLHFNASGWGKPTRANLVGRNDFHLLINGTYALNSEFRKDDQRFELFTRLLQRMHDEELPLNLAVADAMVEATGLPPYIYPGANAKRVCDSDYIWARNLLANRVYFCPVVFLEPYIMNNREVYERIAAGDYEGEREVAGKRRKSLFREYADGVADGLARYYREARSPSAPDP